MFALVFFFFFDSPVLPACAGSTQESTSQGLCVSKIVLEGNVDFLLCNFGDISERSFPQSGTSMDKGIFFLIILANSHSMILMCYYA